MISDYAARRAKLGSKIRSYRTSQHLSLRKLGLMTAIDYSYLHSIEKGTANATVDTLFKICDALDINIRLLFED